MSLTGKLNELIRTKGKIDVGYEVVDFRPPNTETTKYDTYMSKEVFAEFQKDMNPQYKKMYDKGNGSEMTERRRAKKKYPPKMASFSSSSRLTYCLFKDIKNIGETRIFFDDGDTYEEVIFEGKLKIKAGGRPNIDAILIGKKSIVFIEVKCQEFYNSSKKVNILSTSYKKELEKYSINNLKTVVNNQKKYIDLGTELKRFDLQQTVKHLLGINNFICKSKEDETYSIKYGDNKSKVYKDQKVVFVNLFFNPETLEEGNDPSFKKDLEKLSKIYDKLIGEAESNQVQDIIYKLKQKNGIIYKVLGHDELGIAMNGFYKHTSIS